MTDFEDQLNAGEVEARGPIGPIGQGPFVLTAGHFIPRYAPDSAPLLTKGKQSEQSKSNKRAMAQLASVHVLVDI